MTTSINDDVPFFHLFWNNRDLGSPLMLQSWKKTLSLASIRQQETVLLQRLSSYLMLAYMYMHIILVASYFYSPAFTTVSIDGNWNINIVGKFIIDKNHSEQNMILIKIFPALLCYHFCCTYINLCTYLRFNQHEYFIPRRRTSMRYVLLCLWRSFVRKL